MSVRYTLWAQGPNYTSERRGQTLHTPNDQPPTQAEVEAAIAGILDDKGIYWTPRNGYVWTLERTQVDISPVAFPDSLYHVLFTESTIQPFLAHLREHCPTLDWQLVVNQMDKGNRHVDFDHNDYYLEPVYTDIEARQFIAHQGKWTWHNADPVADAAHLAAYDAQVAALATV